MDDEILTAATHASDEILTHADVDGITKAEFFLAMLERGYPAFVGSDKPRLPAEFVSLTSAITDLAFRVCQEREWLEEDG